MTLQTVDLPIPRCFAACETDFPTSTRSCAPPLPTEMGIECLFADAKTRGCNIENTHIANPAKLATLLVIVALAMTWACRCASRTMGRQGIPKKLTSGARNHGFGSGSTCSDVGSCMTRKKPFKPGCKPAPRDQFQTQAGAALYHKSCTMAKNAEFGPTAN